MAYEMKDGDFSLFKNEKKTESNHPDYTGKCMISGVTYRMAAWIKKGERAAFFTGKISEAQAKAAEVVDDPINPTVVLEPGPLEIDTPAPDPAPTYRQASLPIEKDDLPF